MRALIASIRLIVRAGMLSAILLAAGFVAFAASMERDEVPRGKKADGIVALTGGKARIGEAVRLLADGRAKRMLVTGVNPATTGDQLGRLVPRGGELFKCCIDLGRQAQDTSGNAVETRQWVERHGFRSIIVVTSSYHMPRTLIELKRVLPDTQIMPHGVEPGSFQAPDWWTNRAVLRLVASEYVKYLSALGLLLLSRVGIDLRDGPPPTRTAAD